MSTAHSNPLSAPGLPSLFEELVAGRLPWNLISSRLQHPRADTSAGKQAVDQLTRLLTAFDDPRQAACAHELPAELVHRLRSENLLNLSAPAEAGGRDLPPRAVLHVIEKAARWSPALGLLLAYHNGLGAPAYVSELAEGPLKRFLTDRLAHGALTGAADTEPGGAANLTREMTATVTDDGAAYLLDGKKIFTGNGALAQLLVVTATVQEPSGPKIRQFFVDTSTPGVTPGRRHRFMGLHGATNTTVTFTAVRVLRDRVLAEEKPHAWAADRQMFPTALGRLYVIAAPALAIVRQCLEFTGEFVQRRTVDDRPLSEHDEIRRTVAASLADLHAIESVVDWTVVKGTAAADVHLLFEQFAAKDIIALLTWRTVERTMTLLAGEGYETAHSKAARGTTPSHLEGIYRDARGLRIAGGVESLLQSRLGGFALSCFTPLPDSGTPSADATPPRTGAAHATAPALTDPRLSPRNRVHLQEAARWATRLHATCQDASTRSPDLQSLLVQERLLALVGAIIEELITMVLTLGTTAVQAEHGVDHQDLADITCTAARNRLADCHRQLEQILLGTEPRYACVSDAWLRGTGRVPYKDGTPAQAPQQSGRR
ncbi:acyl-CoA dehydrogenase family protein [Streptomyces sp. NPDC126514]|uniref:acyl-CoA dehydrogenase family protein n=1 Tax=Streptomyces sp. NPDC126514 TaxID=3155210 RepID=UPI00331EA9D1